MESKKISDIKVDKIRVISFDLDNTLYDNQPVIKLAEEESQKYLKSEFLKQNKNFNFELFVSTRKRLFESKNIAYDNLTLLRQDCLRYVCAELENSESIVKKATEIFLQYRQRATIPNEITCMLEKLSSRYTLVSVTNGNCDASNLVVGKYFSKNYSPQLGHRAKPHIEMYNEVIKDHKIQAEQLLHVGDEEQTDGLGATKAGCQFYLLTPFSSPQGLNSSIDSFLHSLSW